MNRITIKDLQCMVDRINTVTGSPMQSWTDGKANVGNYHLDWAYGGVALDRMYNTSGGVSSASVPAASERSASCTTGWTLICAGWSSANEP